MSSSDDSDASEGEREKTLDDDIEASLHCSKFQNRKKYFLPENQVKELVTRHSVIKAFKWEGEELAAYQDELVDWICERAPKVFLTHVRMDLKKPSHLSLSLSKFKNNNIGDAEFLKAKQSSAEGYLSKAIWTPRKTRELFEEYRWMFFSPAFREDEIDYDLHADTIFPFEDSPDDMRIGAFSHVHRVKIHDAHQAHGFREVAIKEIFLNRSVETKDAAEQEWDTEAANLRSINELNHAHTVKCLAAIRRGEERYFMFPWANGGSLADFWKTAEQQEPTEDLVCQVVRQLRALADALDHLHCFGPVPGADFHDGEMSEVRIELDGQPIGPGGNSLRHGDLKPENILRFVDNDEMSKSSKIVGTLKLADMGLAKRHHVGTQYRKNATSTKYGTRRYEAPDVVTQSPRSRRYDVWSMGCITFEFILWILYGNKTIKELYRELDVRKDEPSPFYEIHVDRDGKQATVHQTVRRWIHHLETHEPECRRGAVTAIGDLLKIVKTKLLVVDLPPYRSSAAGTELTPGPHFAPPSFGEETRHYRTSAKYFREALDDIISKFGQKSYILSGTAREGVLPLRRIPGPDLLIHSHSGNGLMNSGPRNIETHSNVSMTRRADYSLPPQEGWEFPVDNDFAAKVVAEVGEQALVPQTPGESKLCQRCDNLKFFRAGFNTTIKCFDLLRERDTCDLCPMLYEMHRKHGAYQAQEVRIVRINSTIQLKKESGGHSGPQLSIIRSPDNEVSPDINPIQIGFPELLQPGSAAFFALLRLWLQDCDERHAECQALNDSPLPKRLLDIGTDELSKVRLIETNDNPPKEGRYVALSHRWGSSEKHPPFVTLRKDPAGRGRDIASFKTEVPWQEIPATFKDAIKTTRALGLRYLWIDSLCIIQGPDGDFNEEAKRMERVFSGAYCVLAASRANSQHEGFLKEFEQREYLTFKRGNERPFYICKTIDDFNHDVLEGELNKRGWVLQERALARRTVYFTATQTYFECGKGVRCQTLTRMCNERAGFLGDPNFPDKAMTAGRGYQIEYFQQLYRQYSRLDFTEVADRPVAIEGLENRLREAFKSGGNYGIFDDGLDNRNKKGLFHRSLLWRRGGDVPLNPGLRRIIFPASRNASVPTWSWMCYSGGIDFLDVPFDQVTWEGKDIYPNIAAGRDGSSELHATVRGFLVDRLDSAELIYDVGNGSFNNTAGECVVVARSKSGIDDQNRRFYVLIVSPTHSQAVGGDVVYERVGVGYMPGTAITLDTSGTARLR